VLCAQAPAKLILSGEHAVLYGCPALACAIDLPTQTCMTFNNDAPAGLHLQLPDLDLTLQLSWQALEDRADALQAVFRPPTQDQHPFNHRLNQPSDLVILALASKTRVAAYRHQACSVTLSSQAWLGRGLGSSAACLVTLLAAWQASHQDSLTLTQPQLSALINDAQALEHYQHGRSSGLDPSIITQGGAGTFLQASGLTSLPEWPLSAWLIDTGAPASSTGECVAAVAKHQSAHSAIWSAFTRVTQQIQQAWLTQDTELLCQGLNLNHQLLCDLGVVPAALDQSIDQLRKLGAGVKMCGAGSVKGDAGGVLLYLGDASPALICQAQGWRFQAIRLGSPGLRLKHIEISA